MNASPIRGRRVARVQSALTATVRFACRAGRLPLVAVLTLLEPMVRAVFSLAMVLGVIAAVVFELSAVGPRFPFLEILTVSLGFGLALVAYYGLCFLISH